MMPKLTLVLGGASSGKSAFAEGLMREVGSEKIYIATAQAFDAEMEAKIAAHRQMRGTQWETIEAPQTLPEVIGNIPGQRRVLIDCATMWLSNRLLAEADMDSEISCLLQALHGCASPIVIVSNEIGQGIVPENFLGRRFRDLQGRLNRLLAERADLVVAVMAGLPLTLKGALPEMVEW
ncbi:bifunctional adenosylcobinamide kinase/adenosylcobinamide-phosphate guanylyltransferase [Tropicimonas isoalkanivorans]|uniref:Bifunctional adenosylcobalamin biosynthesis protein n=1 Tax=Tropicimonas isoalkanivorans TaxID=441112 RepID=A0A1I1JDK6_9RHOB|nr:bifunctional adenosylcobinamide kinase/adenosylcobinamide-phosphate guanylyltransferase [Tropicimonas isoalkanivorans]SFC46221.1 adenosylcobinamide kinase /adenosylcobinamide-phosphate guanylyltransferase [Tropicimonas isoalkanivorans]